LNEFENENSLTPLMQVSIPSSQVEVEVEVASQVFSLLKVEPKAKETKKHRDDDDDLVEFCLL
jgi:hypothetical protein